MFVNMCKLIKVSLCFLLCVPLYMALLEDRENVCGYRKISRTPKIINGKEAYHGQFPWAVSIRLHRRHHCGGALINHNWVLTAAHCVAQISARSFTVKLGGHYRNTEHETTSIETNVAKTVPHESFSFSSFANDIALLKLAKSIEYNNYIWPVCLPQSENTDYYNQSGVVIGWGKITPTGVSATSLQQVELPIIDNSKCIKWYESQGKVIPIRSSQFCAGLEEGGKDACQGDSGSPMMRVDQNSGQAMAIGIVSAGIGCALPRLPGLYTRISSYLPWITKQIAEVTVPTTKAPIPTEKPTIVITNPSTTDVSKIFNTSYPVWTIPPSNHTFIIHFPIFNQTHHITHDPTLSTSTTTTTTPNSTTNNTNTE